MLESGALAVVVPVHNRRALTQACLSAVSQQTVDGFRVIVVDDGSTDGTAEMVLSHFPNVELVRGDGTLWWSGSVNRGIAHGLASGAGYFLLLNDDTIPDREMFAALLAAAQENPSALVGAVTTDAGGSFLYGGEIVDWSHARFSSLLDVLPASHRRGLHEVTHLPGRGLLIPARVFEEIGMFDSVHFPQAIADYDFTQHARRRGHPNLVCFEARMVALPDETANVKLRQAPSLRNYYEHLFGVRGAANLPRFVRYAIRNCPPRYLVPFITLGLTRRVGGYARDWARHSRSKSTRTDR